MKISVETHRRLIERLSGQRRERLTWWDHWRDLADYFLPRRYQWLLSPDEARRRVIGNPNVLDATGIIAARTLASGMMNGITSPSRPWFRLHSPGFLDDMESDARVWLDEVQRRMMLVMAESNFYNALAVMYLDLAVFGTAASIIYEHPTRVIHCYNPALGEFYLSQDAYHRVNGITREYYSTAEQLVAEFGLDNVSEQTRAAYNAAGARRLNQVACVHMIEPNLPGADALPRRFEYRETYWEKGGPQGLVLRRKGFRNFPAIVPRWDLTGNDVYGTSPAMDALGDVKQLQHETKKKAQALDKLVSPPVLADIQLRNTPLALMPNGITYVYGVNNVGVKPIYSINPPLGEMTQDLLDVRQRIRTIFHNELFQMISQLDTVRSAAEIDARREEKLVLLGPVLERFENEALDPAVSRVFGIMADRGLLPPMPQQLQGRPISIQYVSILAAAQSAVGTASMERWLQLIGNLSPVWPEVKVVPNITELISQYGKDLGVPEKLIRPDAEVKQLLEQANEQAAQQEAMANAGAMAQTGQVLSQTDVGGGANALQMMLGG